MPSRQLLLGSSELLELPMTQLAKIPRNTPFALRKILAGLVASTLVSASFPVLAQKVTPAPTGSASGSKAPPPDTNAPAAASGAASTGAGAAASPGSAPSTGATTAPTGSGSAAATDTSSDVQVASLSTVPEPTVAARAWITIDAASGQVLGSSNPDMKIEPASLTKLMTGYVVFDALDEKRLTLEQQVTISQKAWRTGGSRMFIEPRKPVTVDELIQGMIVQSGNDASVALAEAVAGSEDAFASLMNQEAARLGMKSTHFVNADGLPNPQHVMSVRDLATLAVHITTDHPTYYHYYKQKEYTYNKIKQPNRNRLLWADPTVDGLKTGHTEAAGYCLVATALRGDRRVVTVLVGADSDSTRTEESLKLLNWSFQNFDSVKLFDTTQAPLQARVWEGTSETVNLGPPKPVWISVPRGRAAAIKPVANRSDPLVAPLEKSQSVGTLSFQLDGKVLRTTPLVVQASVERAGFVGRMVDTVKRWFQ
jgi:D-alanyl-D-alanine carboxypeptidase (penicillin-binding protein 5/6)